ncbi:MAG: nuclear transport factor 2 family protein [Comamonadaceae bacterium]
MKNTIESIVQVFEGLTLEQVEQLDKLYASDARFKDPFNDVRGVAAIQRIFRHMYLQLEAPHFVIDQQIIDGRQCFLTWEFRFFFRRFSPRVEQVILGGSHLVLDEAGRITLHRDYWDAAEELYEKIPVIGGLMRWLKKRANS